MEMTRSSTFGCDCEDAHVWRVLEVAEMMCEVYSTTSMCMCTEKWGNKESVWRHRVGEKSRKNTREDDAYPNLKF